MVQRKEKKYAIHPRRKVCVWKCLECRSQPFFLPCCLSHLLGHIPFFGFVVVCLLKMGESWENVSFIQQSLIWVRGLESIYTTYIAERGGNCARYTAKTVKLWICYGSNEGNIYLFFLPHLRMRQRNSHEKGEFSFFVISIQVRRVNVDIFFFRTFPFFISQFNCWFFFSNAQKTLWVIKFLFSVILFAAEFFLQWNLFNWLTRVKE